MKLVCTLYPNINIDQSLKAAEKALACGADLIEWRLDQLTVGEESEEDVISISAELVKKTKSPVILTMRSSREGGRCLWPYIQRLSVLKTIVNISPPRMVDFEFNDVKNSPEDLLFFKKNRIDTILSHHDLDSSCLSKRSLLLKMYSLSNISILKIAWYAKSFRDVFEAIDLARSSPVPTIAIPMGKKGHCARLLGIKGDMPLMYFSIEKEWNQMKISEATGVFKIKDIGKKTKVYGLVGKEIDNSPGYLFYNNFFQESNLDSCYIPIEINEGMESLKAFFVSDFTTDKDVSLGGLSITSPHKKNIVKIAKDLHYDIGPNSKLSGVANTFTKKSNCFTVEDYDGSSLVKLLKTTYSIDPKGKTALVLGCGGVGCSIASAFILNGMKVFLLNRNENTGRKEFKRLSNVYSKDTVHYGVPKVSPNIIVQATSLGGTSEGLNLLDLLNINKEKVFNINPVFIESVISNQPTELEFYARNKGCLVITGKEFWKSQSESQRIEWFKNIF